MGESSIVLKKGRITYIYSFAGKGGTNENKHFT